MSCPKGGTLFFIALGLLAIKPIRAQTAGEVGKVKLAGRFETKNSFIRTNYALILCGKIGLEIEKYNLQVGIGYEWLQSRFVPSYFNRALHNGQPPAQPRLRYGNLYASYRFYRENGWEFSVPLQIGFGESMYQPGQGHAFARAFIMPIESGIDINFFPIPLLGIGVGLGYRVMAIDNARMEVRSDSPYYQARIKVQFGELIKVMKQPKN